MIQWLFHYQTGWEHCKCSFPHCDGSLESEIVCWSPQVRSLSLKYPCCCWMIKTVAGYHCMASENHAVYNWLRYTEHSTREYDITELWYWECLRVFWWLVATKGVKKTLITCILHHLLKIMLIHCTTIEWITTSIPMLLLYPHMSSYQSHWLLC